MERLTYKARYEAGYKLNKGVKEWQAADRLGAYENTGLIPPEIMELKERDTAKAARPISDRSLYGICLNCGQTIFGDHRFCPDCGQRLKWEDRT